MARRSPLARRTRKHETLADRRRESVSYLAGFVKKGAEITHEPLRGMGVDPLVAFKAKMDQVVWLIGAAHPSRDDVVANHSRLVPASLTHAEGVVDRVRHHQAGL